MISVEQAKKLIVANSGPLPSVRVPLPQALGLVLARDIFSPSDYPLYDVSAMDGYAFRALDIQAASPSGPFFLKIRGAQQAGERPMGSVKVGECFRVRTGGMIPSGADSVLEREKVLEKKGLAVIQGPVLKGRNIRYRGEGIRKGELALKTGTRLHSRAIGFLASLGIDSVQVHPFAKVALLVTGDELMKPGKKLRLGQIYNSNQWMLETALREWGVESLMIKTIPDQPRHLRNQVQKALKFCDLILLVGGVSVGDSDFSKSVLGSLGVKRLFWRVSQKPGYPLYFGKKGKTLVFGLPGNPASAWVNFHEYVVPCLKILQGLSPESPRQEAKLISDGPHRSSKTLFLKAQLREGSPISKVKLLKGQGSHLLQSLAQGDCLAVVPRGKGRLKKGMRLEIHPLPNGQKP